MTDAAASGIIIGASHHAFPDRKTDTEAIPIARDEGLDLVEFFGNDFTPEVMREIRRTASAAGILVAWHPWLDLAELSPAREISACLEEIVREAVVCGAENVILHMGSSPEADRPSRLSALAEGFALAAPSARDAGVCFCVENVPAGWGEMLGDRLEDFRFLFERTDADVVGFNLDTGHAVLSGGPENYIDSFAPRLVYSHLQSNSGLTDEHLGYPKGVLDWEGTLRAILRTGFRGPYNMEFTYKEGGRELRDLLRRLATEYSSN